MKTRFFFYLNSNKNKKEKNEKKTILQKFRRTRVYRKMIHKIAHKNILKYIAHTYENLWAYVKKNGVEWAYHRITL